MNIALHILQVSAIVFLVFNQGAHQQSNDNNAERNRRTNGGAMDITYEELLAEVQALKQQVQIGIPGPPGPPGSPGACLVVLRERIKSTRK